MQSQSHLAGCAGSSVFIWSPVSNGSVSVSQPQVVTCAVAVSSCNFSSNNRVLAIAGADGIVQLWNGQNYVGSLPNEQTGLDVMGPLSCVRFSKDSKTLILGSTNSCLYLWDLKAQALRSVFRGHQAAVTSIAIADDYLASASADGAVLLHVSGSTDTLAELSAPEVANGRTAHHTGRLAKRSLCFSPLEPSLLAAASDDGGVHLWSIRGERPQHYALARRHAGPVAGVSFSTASAPLLFSCGADGQVLMWDRRAGEGAPEVQRALLPSRLSCMAMRDDGVTMAVGATDPRVFLVDARRLDRVVAELPCPASPSSSEPSPLQELHWQTSRSKKAVPPGATAAAGSANTVTAAGPGPGAGVGGVTAVRPDATAAIQAQGAPGAAGGKPSATSKAGAAAGAALLPDTATNGTQKPGSVRPAAPAAAAAATTGAVMGVRSAGQPLPSTPTQLSAGGPEGSGLPPGSGPGGLQLLSPVSGLPPPSHPPTQAAGPASSSLNTWFTAAASGGQQPDQPPSLVLGASGTPGAPGPMEAAAPAAAPTVAGSRAGAAGAGAGPGLSRAGLGPGPQAGQASPQGAQGQVASSSAQTPAAANGTHAAGGEALSVMDNSPAGITSSSLTSPRSGKPASAALVTGVATSLRAGLSEAVFKSCLDDAVAGLREDMRNMHIEIVKQFHMQQLEMRDLASLVLSQQAELRSDLQGVRQQLDHLARKQQLDWLG